VGGFIPSPGQPAPLKDGEFVPSAPPNITSFGFDRIDPPSTLYIQRDDILVLEAFTSVANESVTFTVRFLLPPSVRGGQPSDARPDKRTGVIQAGGIIEPQTFVIQPLQNQSSTQLRVNLGEGYLLSISAGAAQAVIRGQTFARAILLRGSGTITQPAYALFADYCALRHAIGWPSGRVVMPDEGQGATAIRSAGVFAAGVDWTFTSPSSVVRSKIISGSALLTASATAANRNVEIIVDDGANIVWRTSVGASITAGQAATVSLTTSNSPAGVVTLDQQAVIPPGLVLRPGWRLRSNTVNIQAGDQWSNIWVMEETLLEQF
jgi:hypothetical protein